MKKTLLAFAFLATITTAQANDVPTDASRVHPLLIGSQVPAGNLLTVDGKPFNLALYVKKQPTIIIFYRGGWCPYCNLHLSELQDIEKDLTKMGYSILTISADSPEELSKSQDKQKPGYTLLSDNSMEMAKAFGIAFRVSDDMLKKYKKYNIDIEAASGKKHHLLPVPAVFIAGQDGVIRFQYVNPDYSVRLSGYILLTAAKVYSKKGK